ncbi:cell division protein FtsL, partial [Clostridium saudiense]|nr:cell division protein FtsL [Clostridium saudiense]
MVVREYDYIRGNTALAPERKIKEQEVKKKKKQVKKEFDWKNHRVKIISSAVIVSILGVASLTIDSYVYKIQKNLSNLEVEMEVELAKSEAMKVDLLKVSSLDNIN